MLKFYDETHQYEIDGIVVPGVSQIIRFLSREVYGDVSKYLMENAADRGTRVHEACESLDRTGEVECDADIAPYVEAYAKFLQEHEVKWLMIEAPLYNPELMYAGTIDRYGYVDDTLVLVDIKSSSSVNTRLITAQLNAYEKLPEKAPEKLYKLHLRNDGTYVYRPIPKDDSTFMACLALHRAMETRKRRKELEQLKEQLRANEHR